MSEGSHGTNETLVYIFVMDNFASRALSNQAFGPSEFFTRFLSFPFLASFYTLALFSHFNKSCACVIVRILRYRSHFAGTQAA